MLPQEELEHLHGLQLQVCALEALLEFGALIGQIALLFVGVFKRLAHSTYALLELLDLLP